MIVLLLLPLLMGIGAGRRPAHEEPLTDAIMDPTAEKALASSTSAAPCEGGLAAGVFPCRGMTLLSFVPLSTLATGATSGSNLWGFRSRSDSREYALIGLDTGTAVVDVTDAIHPRLVGSVPGQLSRWREVKVFQRFEPAAARWKAWAYVVTEASGGGLQILDLSDLPRSVSLAATWRGFDTAHTLTLANVEPSTGEANQSDVAPVLYIQGFDKAADIDHAGILALDLGDPVSPVLLGSYRDSYAHDTWAGVLRGTRASAFCSGHDPCELVVNWAGWGIVIVDFTDKANPVVLSQYIYPGLGYAHSGSISADGNHLFSTDELDEERFGGNSRVRVIDISDLVRPAVVASWLGPTGAVDHNGYVVANRYFLSNYERGVTVLDVTDPLRPRDLAFLDVFPSADANELHGTWGVYPFLPSGTVLASNIDGAGGLYLMRLSPDAAGEPPRDPIVRPARRSPTPRVDGPRPIP
ncbi:MAG TPA: choice-of-anchor B family protein [Thermoanaerobaculia bacterium]|nr:choice-of-anchor B family protein [Thermoanaerobaculia bacterium]